MQIVTYQMCDLQVPSGMPHLLSPPVCDYPHTHAANGFLWKRHLLLRGWLVGISSVLPPCGIPGTKYQGCCQQVLSCPCRPEKPLNWWSLLSLCSLLLIVWVLYLRIHCLNRGNDICLPFKSCVVLVLNTCMFGSSWVDFWTWFETCAEVPFPVVSCCSAVHLERKTLFLLTCLSVLCSFLKKIIF